MWDDGLDGVGVGALNNGLGSSLSGVLHWDHLVTDSGEDILKHVDEVWLDCWVDLAVVGDGTNGVQRTLPGKGILLVAELLPEQLYGSKMVLVACSNLFWYPDLAHFVGASSSSMSPLMKTAISWEAPLISSCSLEMFNFCISWSRTLMDCLFSDMIAGDCEGKVVRGGFEDLSRGGGERWAVLSQKNLTRNLKGVSQCSGDCYMSLIRI